MNLEFKKCINNGTVNGTNMLGGIAGLINNNTAISIVSKGCVNNGNISGDSYVSGFFGYIAAVHQVPTSVDFLNCQNNGVIQGKSQNQCGFFCVSNNDDQKSIISTVFNSVNKGNLIGVNVYGFSNIVTNNAANSVSFGKLDGKNGFLFFLKKLFKSEFVYL